MNVTIEDSFHGVLGFFGLLAYPHEKDVLRAEKFRKALFYVWANEKAYQLKRDINSASSPLQAQALRDQLKNLQPLLNSEKLDRVLARVDTGMKHLLKGSMLMSHLLARGDEVIRIDAKGVTGWRLNDPSKAVSDREFMCRVREQLEFIDDGVESNNHKMMSRYLPSMALHAAFADVNKHLKIPLCAEGLRFAAMAQEDGQLWYPLPLGSSHSKKLELLSQGVHWLQVVASDAESSAEQWRRRTRNGRGGDGVEQVTIKIISRE